MFVCERRSRLCFALCPLSEAAGRWLFPLAALFLLLAMTVFIEFCFLHVYSVLWFLRASLLLITRTASENRKL